MIYCFVLFCFFYLSQQLDALEIDEATVSSIGLDSFMPRSYSTYQNRHDSGRFDSRPPLEPAGFAVENSSQKSGLSRVVQEVSAKIEKMKKELQEKKERAKQLQGDLLRVDSATERRQKKLTEKWELQLKKLDEEHNKTYKEMRGFRDHLVQDVKKLEAQSSELRVKMQKLSHEHDQQILLAKQENLKKLENAKKQWKQDEKGFMDKVLNSRMEQLKKQAVDALTPELDNVVRTNKEALEAARVENENIIRKLMMNLEHDVERKMEAFRQSLQDEVRDESTKAQEVAKKRLETARKALEHEQDQLKIKFEADKHHMTVESERLIQQEDALHQQSMSTLQEKQAGLIQELLTEQQKAMAELMQDQSKDVARVQSQIKEDVRLFQESLYKLQSQQSEVRFKFLQQEILTQIAQETDEIHCKLRNDAEQQRKDLVSRYEAQLVSLRHSLSGNVEALQEQEGKAQLRLVQLRSEVEQLKGHLESKRQSNPALLHMISYELKPRLQTLRQDLRLAENEYYQQEESLKRTVEDTSESKADELQQLQQRLVELQAQEEDQAKQLATKRSQSETDFAVCTLLLGIY